MSKKKHYKQEDTLENVEYALSRTEKFIEDNQKILIIVVLALVILVGGFWAYRKLYRQPLETRAQKEAFYAQLYFERDSFNLAINGDGINPGFLDLIDEYGSTKIGKLSRYYTGVSYLKTGNFDEAINYLKKFTTNDPKLKAISTGAIGDCYSELGNTNEAISWYAKAATVEDDITTPFYLMKQGILLEQGGEKEKALNVYQTIKDKYKTSSEARQIDKYITRISL
ncbi:MAG: tetratricopeptide repeat protein [Cytophagaceae bacterium]|jgi:tetratricopeptide (TPR) repeat protein|nr:tetratricopeptide repeat protein [Cytophagaceae bacterium]